MAEKITPSFDLEFAYAHPVVGIDEVGMGPWAGPVVAAAVILSRDTPLVLLKQLNDSKKLSEKTREYIFEQLLTHPEYVHMGIGQASVEEIDAINIRQAAMLAMQRAVACLPVQPSAALVDGTAKPDLSCPVQLVIKGDQKSFSIAAASIVAKVTRDRLMKELAQQHPAYGWETNAGYGTAVHQAALKKHGVTPWHRRSYAPIRVLLEKDGC
jgi:ribonuclease HII